MALTPQEVEHLARLAKIELTPEEQQQYPQQLSRILDYLSKLQAVDTADLPPLHQVIGTVNVTRPDHVVEHPAPESLVTSAPAHDDGYIVAPLVRTHDADGAD